jgi:hypothetical protein
MAMGGPNPGIWGESVRKALNSSGERDAHEQEAGVEQALLDKAELQELERSELYGETTRAARQPSRLRMILHRLFGRSA